MSRVGTAHQMCDGDGDVTATLRLFFSKWHLALVSKRVALVLKRVALVPFDVIARRISSHKSPGVGHRLDFIQLGEEKALPFCPTFEVLSLAQIQKQFIWWLRQVPGRCVQGVCRLLAGDL